MASETHEGFCTRCWKKVESCRCFPSASLVFELEKAGQAIGVEDVVDVLRFNGIDPEEGLEKARRERGGLREVTISDVERIILEAYNDLSRSDLDSLGPYTVFRDEILARLAALK